MTFVLTLEEVSGERDSSHSHTDDVRQDFSVQVCASSSLCR
jgi:hypothetical protein